VSSRTFIISTARLFRRFAYIYFTFSNKRKEWNNIFEIFNKYGIKLHIDDFNATPNMYYRIQNVNAVNTLKQKMLQEYYKKYKIIMEMY